MSAKQTLELVERLTDAKARHDMETYAAGLAEDAVFEMAGVPESMGGVLRGRDAIIREFERTKGMSRWETYDMFGDDSRVCVVGKTTVEHSAGTDTIRPSERGYTTDECVVYWVENGKVVRFKAYINWLHAHVQSGLIDLATLLK